MLATAGLCSRLGSKPIIVGAACLLLATLPLLALAPSTLLLALALMLFGAALGSLDVAMNLHAVDVERAAATPLMSGFHALFSIGGFAGAALMTSLLSMGILPFASTVICALLMAASLPLMTPGLLRAVPATAAPFFAWPRGMVVLLAPLAAITFLVEGAMLDWGALLITGRGLVSVEQGGLGYILFSIAMTAGRLTGDAITARMGERAVLQAGGLIAVAGFVTLLGAESPVVALSGFVLIGLGASNVVPVFFRLAASQRAMPAGLAIAAMTTTGYAGVLLGPAAIGPVARAASLPFAFWLLAGLLALVPLTAHLLTRPATAH